MLRRDSAFRLGLIVLVVICVVMIITGGCTRKEPDYDWGALARGAGERIKR